MQQYRYSNFSDVFCLNCNFVIDAAVKQLVSRSFQKYGASDRPIDWTTQIRRNVAAVASRWLPCVRFDRPGN